MDDEIEDGRERMCSDGRKERTRVAAKVERLFTHAPTYTLIRRKVAHGLKLHGGVNAGTRLR